MTAFSAVRLEPHFKQMTACGLVADPQTGQNKRPACAWPAIHANFRLPTNASAVTAKGT